MLATIDALPPLPGLIVDRPNQMQSTIALHATYLTIVTLCVSMRIYTRHFISHQQGWDECKTPLSVVIE